MTANRIGHIPSTFSEEDEASYSEVPLHDAPNQNRIFKKIAKWVGYNKKTLLTTTLTFSAVVIATVVAAIAVSLLVSTVIGAAIVGSGIIMAITILGAALALLRNPQEAVAKEVVVKPMLRRHVMTEESHSQRNSVDSVRIQSPQQQSHANPQSNSRNSLYAQVKLASSVYFQLEEQRSTLENAIFDHIRSYYANTKFGSDCTYCRHNVNTATKLPDNNVEFFFANYEAYYANDDYLKQKIAEYIELMATPGYKKFLAGNDIEAEREQDTQNKAVNSQLEEREDRLREAGIVTLDSSMLETTVYKI